MPRRFLPRRIEPRRLPRPRRDPTKSRAEREAQLHRLAETGEGCDTILYLWKEVKGIPAGTAAPDGTLIRAQMIPELLAHEYPNG